MKSVSLILGSILMVSASALPVIMVEVILIADQLRAELLCGAVPVFNTTVRAMPI